MLPSERYSAGVTRGTAATVALLPPAFSRSAAARSTVRKCAAWQAEMLRSACARLGASSAWRRSQCLCPEVFSPRRRFAVTSI